MPLNNLRTGKDEDLEKIATDISTFENLRKGGYVYVDKTDMPWRLF